MSAEQEGSQEKNCYNWFEFKEQAVYNMERYNPKYLESCFMAEVSTRESD